VEDIELSTLNSPDGETVAVTRRSPWREVPLNKLEQEHILATLEATNWNKSRAAAILGIERSTLDRKLKRYKVSRPNH
jgi:Nif-specific regulatory protein